MMKQFLLLLCCVILIGCSNDSTTTSNNIDSNQSPEVTQTEQDAFDLLFNSAQFASSKIGFAGSHPEQVGAFQTVLASDNAEYLFKKLQTDAKIEGQMYGLCGLYFVEKRYFDSVIPAYHQTDAQVSTFIGCVISSQPVREVVPAIEDGVWPESYRDCQL